MNDLKAFTGRSFKFKDICTIYPPTVNDILDNDSFFTGLGLLTITQEDLWDEINLNQEKEDPRHRWKVPENAPTPFSLLIAQYSTSEDFRAIINNIFEIFTHNKILIWPGFSMVIIVDKKLAAVLDNENTDVDFDDLGEEDLKLITEDNYFDFQNAIREAVGTTPAEKPDLSRHPRVLRMDALARIRDKKKASKNSISMKTTLTAICCMGIGITPLNIGEITYASVNSLIMMYQQKEGFEQMSTTARFGLLDTSKGDYKHWIRNLEQND